MKMRKHLNPHGVVEDLQKVSENNSSGDELSSNSEDELRLETYCNVMKLLLE